MTFELQYKTPIQWTETVLKDFDSFLIDHAAAEKKASGMAMSMISHYPDRIRLVQEMIELSIEELAHFREVVKIMHSRDLVTASDEKDAYVNQLRQTFRKGTEVYLLDRLLIAGIIEARGCERFGLIAEALEAGKLQKFYHSIATSEFRHQKLFIELANEYFPEKEVQHRLDQLLEIEAKIVAALPFRAALH